MAPHHRRSSVTSFQSQLVDSRHSSLSVARLSGMSGADGRAGCNPTPRELIHHETLSALIDDVRHLQQRCNSLDQANVALENDMRAMKAAQSDDLTQTARSMSVSDFGSRGKLGLTSYASSEGDGSSETAASGKDVVDKHDFEAFKDFINQKVDAMTEILATFKAEVNAEGVARYKLGQELDRTKTDATKTKGRLGALEVGMKDVRRELEGLAESSSQAQSGRTHSVHPGPYEERESSVMHNQLAAALSEIEDLTVEVKDQAAVIKDLQGRLDGLPSSTAPRELTAAEFASRISKTSTSPGHTSADMTFMQQVLKSMTRKAEMQQKIDDMYSKDQLHLAYAQLSRCIQETSPSDVVLATGDFTGTHDELWSLRDRVVRRLTTIDKYGDALDDAKRAQAYM